MQVAPYSSARHAERDTSITLTTRYRTNRTASAARAPRELAAGLGCLARDGGSLITQKPVDGGAQAPARPAAGSERGERIPTLPVADRLPRDERGGGGARLCINPACSRHARMRAPTVLLAMLMSASIPRRFASHHRLRNPRMPARGTTHTANDVKAGCHAALTCDISIIRAVTFPRVGRPHRHDSTGLRRGGDRHRKMSAASTLKRSYAL